eukprot:11158009-Lingulodinium_polyedra.AAC.1
MLCWEASKRLCSQERPGRLLGQGFAINAGLLFGIGEIAPCEPATRGWGETLRGLDFLPVMELDDGRIPHGLPLPGQGHCLGGAGLGAGKADLPEDILHHLCLAPTSIHHAAAMVQCI